MAAPDDNEALTLELEALQFTYGEQLSVERAGAGGACTLTLQLAPRATEHDWERFVAASLRCAVPPGYPDALPAAELADVRGEAAGSAPLWAGWPGGGCRCSVAAA